MAIIPCMAKMRETNNPLDLNLLYAFEAMMRQKTLSHAAASIGLSQSGMSHALERLRTTFGDPLFVRSAGAMKPTPRAEEIATQVLGALALIRDGLTEQIIFLPRTTDRIFTLILTDLGELTLLPRLFRDFQIEAPNGRLRTMQVAPGEVYAHLESARADVAIGHMITAPDGLRQQGIGKYAFVCLYDKERWPGKRPLASVEAYRGAAHVVVTLSGNLRDSYEQHLSRALETMRPNVAMAVPHWTVVPDLLVGTSLVATVPIQLAEHACRRAETLTWAPCPVAIQQADARLLWHPRFNQDPANRWLRQRLLKAYRDGGPSVSDRRGKS